MDWIKLYTDARTDAKLNSLNDAQYRVTMNLLLLSSEQTIRGAIPPMKDRLLALEVAKGDTAVLAETIDVLRDLAIVYIEEDGTILFLNFAKRNGRPPSDGPNETAQRKQKSRAKQSMSRPVTTCHESVTSGHEMSRPRVEESREEQSREDGEGPAHEREEIPAASTEFLSDDFEDVGPIAGLPKSNGHPFSLDQLDRIKAAMPPGQTFNTSGMHHKIRHQLALYVNKGELETDCIPNWGELETEKKVLWFIEALRRAELMDRKPVWRVAYAAKQIGLALQAGVDLLADGWKLPEKGSNIAAFRGRGGIVPASSLLPNLPPADNLAAIAAETAVKQQLANPTEGLRAKLAMVAMAQQQYGPGSPKLAAALTRHNVTQEQLDDFLSEREAARA
jgi:hypothetical protein